jgi:hypothetical protein
VLGVGVTVRVVGLPVAGFGTNVAVVPLPGRPLTLKVTGLPNPPVGVTVIVYGAGWRALRLTDREVGLAERVKSGVGTVSVTVLLCERPPLPPLVPVMTSE